MLIAFFLFGEKLTTMDLTGLAVAAIAVGLVVGPRLRSRKIDSRPVTQSISDYQLAKRNIIDVYNSSLVPDIVLDINSANPGSILPTGENQQKIDSHASTETLISLLIYQQKLIQKMREQIADGEIKKTGSRRKRFRIVRA